MAIDKFNSVDGFSTGFPPRPVIDANGNVTANSLTANGANITGNTLVANLTAVGVVQLGAVANVRITGGSNGQLLSTDGNGNLAFTNVAVGVAGSNTEVQYNANGVLAGAAGLTYDNTTNIVTATTELRSNRLTVSANAADITVNTVGITSNATTNTYTLTLPQNPGSSGQALVTDGTGTLSFANITAVGGTNTQVQYNDAGNLAGSNAFTFDKTTNTVSLTNGNVSNSLAVANALSAGSLTVSGDGIINGNLAVNGNLTYINSNVTTIEDPVFQVGGGPNGAPLTSNVGSGDRGVVLQNWSDAATSPINEFMGWKQGALAGVGEFVLASNATLSGNNNNTVTVNSYGNLRIGGLTATSANLSGNLTAANANITAITASSANITNVTANTANVANLIGGNATFTGNVAANYYNGNGINLTGVVHNAAGNTTAVQYNVGGNFAGNANGFSWTDNTSTLTLDGTAPVAVTGGFQTPRAISFGTANAGAVGSAWLILPDKGSLIIPGNIAYSNTNGESWVTENLSGAFLNQQLDIAVGNGVSLTVGVGGTLSRSNDFQNWTASTFGGTLTGNFNAVTYSPVTTTWIAVGDGGTIATSANDGLNWTQRTSPTTATLTGVAYDNLGYTAVGAGGTVVRSNDGTTWYDISIDDLANVSINDVVWDGLSQIIVVADDGYVGVYGTLGTPWEVRQITDVNLTGIAVNRGSGIPWIAISAEAGQAFISNRNSGDVPFFDRVDTGLTVTLSDVAADDVGGFMFTATTGAVYYLQAPTVGTLSADQANVFHLKVTGSSELGDVSRVGIYGGTIIPPVFLPVTLDANGTITAASVSPFNRGSGYDIPPSIQVSGTLVGPSARPASITSSIDANGAIQSLNIVDGGFGYSSLPLPTLRIGEINKFLRTDGTGNLSWFTLNADAGTGLPAAPLYGLQFSNGVNFGASSNLIYNPITNTLSVGSNAAFTGNIISFSNVANLKIAGGNSNVATLGTPTVSSNAVVSIPVLSGGDGYDYPPTVTIIGANTSRASATATLTGGVVTAINITSGGNGYDPANVTATITAPRIKYLRTSWAPNLSNVVLSWSETEPSNAQITVGGANTQLQFNDNGILNGSALVTFDKNTNTFTSNATVNFGGTYNNATSMWANASPNVALGDVANIHIRGGNANAAIAGTVNLNLADGSITSIDLTSGGDGYTRAPRVVISGANTMSAVVTTTIDANGSVTAFNIVDAGLGYSNVTVTATIAAPTTRFLKTDGDANLAWQEIDTGAQVAGTDNEIQFNNNGDLSASPQFTFDNVTNVMTVGNTANGAVVLTGNGNTNTGITFYADNGNTNHAFTIRPSIEPNTSIANDWTLTLPPNSGANLQFLRVDANGNTRWADPYFLRNDNSYITVANANGNGNISIISSNGVVTVSANGQSNIVNVSSNGTFATTTIQDQLLVTGNTLIGGNLAVSGNIIYSDIDRLAVQNPIIDIGVAANGKPLTIPDLYDRGQAYHFYNANLIQTTINANFVASAVDVVLANNSQFANIEIGQAFYANAANGAAIFPVGTTVANIDAANFTLTLSNASTLDGTVDDQVAVGSDLLNFAGYDQSTNEFVFGSNVAIANFVTTIDANNYGNLRANWFYGSLGNGNTAIAIPNANGAMTVSVGNGNLTTTVANGDINTTVANGNFVLDANGNITIQSTGVEGNLFIKSSNQNIYFSVANTDNAVTISNVEVQFADDIQLTLVGNTGAQSNSVAIKASTDATFDTNYTLTLPVNAGLAYPAIVGSVTVDANASNSITGIVLSNSGYGYDIAPTVTITGSNTSEAVLQAVLAANGSISSFTIVNAGANYNSGANATITSPSDKFLYTDGNGVTSWREVSATGGGSGTSLVNGTSNVVVARNGNITAGVGGTANVLRLTPNGATVTGNFSAANATLTGNSNIGSPGNTVTLYGNIDANLANVNLGQPDSITIAGGNRHQYLETDGTGTGSVSWGNGTIQYRQNNQYAATLVSLSGSSGFSYSAGATVIALNREAWSYTNTALQSSSTSVAGADPVYITGNVVSSFTLGQWLKFSAGEYVAANVYQLLDVTYDSGNTRTVLDVGTHAAISAANYIYIQSQNPVWDYGNVIADTGNIVPGVTQIVFENDPQPANGQPIYATTIQSVDRSPNAITNGANITVWPPLSNPAGYALGEELYQLDSGITYIETIVTTGAITGTIIEDNVLNLTINPNAVSTIANGNSNIRLLANGNILFSSNGISNVVVIGANSANDTFVTVDGNLNIVDDLSVTGNVFVEDTGIFENIIVNNQTKTTELWLSGNIINANIVNAGNYVFDGPERPTVSLTGGGGQNAQISLAWSNATFGGNIYNISGIAILDAGVGYTSIPTVNISGNGTNVTVNTPGEVELITSIGTISNVHIPGGANGQALITDGTGNLRFGYLSANWITAYGLGTPNLATAYTANGNFATGANSVVVKSNGYVGANVESTFPVGGYVTFMSNGASWNQITAVTAFSNIEAQLNFASPLTSDVANGQIIRVGNAEQPNALALGNNLAATYTANTSGVASLRAYPAGSGANANAGVQFNYNNTFQASNSFSFVPNANINAGGLLTAPNVTITGNLVHSPTSNGGFAQFVNGVTFLTANYSNGSPSRVIFSDVERIYIPGGNANAAFAGSATVDANGTITAIALTSGGDGYTVTPTVTVSGPNTTTAIVTPTLDANGIVTGFDIVDGGAGYSNATAVVTISAPTTRFLSTDGAGNLNWQESSGGSGNGNGIPGGANTTIQFNDNQQFNGIANFTYNKTTNVMFVGNSIQVGTDNAAANSNALSTITIGNNRMVVANLSNTLVNTTITSNTVDAVFANFANRANFYNNVVIGADLANSNTTINGISVVVGNANSNTTIGNSRITANNITVTNLTVNATSGTANLGRVSTTKITGGSNNQFLQTDGNGNLSFANGWIQYIGEPVFDITTFSVSNTTLIGNSNVWVDGDAYNYISLGGTVLSSVTSGDSNVQTSGDVTSIYAAGDRIKLTANVGTAVLLDYVVFESLGGYTVLGNSAGAWPSADAGDEILLATATGGALNGETVSFTGVGEVDWYTVNQPVAYDATNTASLIRLTSTLVNAVPAFANVYIVNSAPTYLTEYVTTGSGITGNIDSVTRTLTLSAESADTLSNGNSNIRILANGNILFSSNGVANIISVEGNGANSRVIVANSLTAGNITTTGTGVTTLISNSDINLNASAGNGRVNINGGLVTSNTATFNGNLVARGNLVDLGTVANLVISGGANGQVLSVANANSGNYKLTWTTVSTNSISTTNSTANTTSSVSVDANAGNIRFDVSGRNNAIVISGNSTFTETVLSDDLTVTGNLTVNGNTNYVNINSLSVADPIINLGVTSNGSPLIVNDGKDRGILNHFYGANLVTTLSGNYAANSTLFTVASTTGAFSGLSVFALNANSDVVFSANTVVSNVDVANSQITVSEGSLYEVENGAQLVVGSDNLNFMGWSTANTEFVFANDVSVNDFIVGFDANSIANVKAKTFRGNLEVGNANIIGDGNNWSFSSANTANFLTSNNNTVSVTANTVNVSGNGYVANFSGLVTIASNTNVAISAANVMTFSGNNIRFPNVGNVHILGGNANAAVSGTITLDVDGRITNVVLVTGGDGYTSPPTITVSGPNTLPAIISASISNAGAVTSLAILDSGLGYSSANVAVNIAPPATKFLATDGNGNLSWQEARGGNGTGNGTPGGNNQQVQFNNNGLFGGSNGFTFNRVTSTVTMTNMTVANRVQIQGNVNVTGPNITLGQVSNLHILGGSGNTFLKTDGSGNLSWDTGTDLQPFLRFIAPTTANNQQFTSNAIANLGNSEFYNVMKDGVYLEPIIDWTLVDANTIQVNRFLRQDSVIDILATATEGTLSAGDQPPSFIRAYQQQSQVLSSTTENLIFDTVTVNAGDSIELNNLTGVFTLQPDIIYKLAAEIPTFEISGSQTQVAIQWWDITNNRALGSAAFYYNESSGSDYFSASGSITAVLYPLVETQVSIRVMEGVDVFRELTTNSNPEFITNSQYPWVEIQDVSSTGQAVVTPLGASGALQYNDAGVLAGTAGLVYDKSGLTKLTVLGNLDLSVTPKITVGNISNLSIIGGSNGQSIVTDGTGNLYWGASTPTSIVNGTSNVVVTANGNVTTSVFNRANVMTVASDGVYLAPDAHLSLTGNSGTFNSTANIRASQDSTAEDWTLTLPPNPGEPGYALVTDGTGIATWQDTGVSGNVVGDLLVWTRTASIVRVNIVKAGGVGVLMVGGRDGNTINIPLG